MNASYYRSRLFEPDAGEMLSALELPDRKSGSPRFVYRRNVMPP
jgi:hypothetical protein